MAKGGFTRAKRGRRSAGARRADASEPRKLFLFETLEPRLLLSADLNAAAGQVLVDGLHALDVSYAGIVPNSTLDTNVAFINRSVGDVTQLTNFAGVNQSTADPVSAILAATSNYFYNASLQSVTPTLPGLQSALNAIQTNSAAGVTVSTTLPSNKNTNLETIDLTLTSITAVAATPTTISVAAGDANQTHSLDVSVNLSENSTQTLHLVFGVDMTNAVAPVFETLTAAISSNNEFKGDFTPGDPVTLDGASQSVIYGHVDLVTNLSLVYNASSTSPILFDGQSNGFANATATQTLAGASADGMTAPVSLVTLSTDGNNSATAITLDDNLANNSEIVTVASVPSSPLVSEVLNGFNDLVGEITAVANQVQNASAFAASFPFIGKDVADAIGVSGVVTPAIDAINGLESQIQQDFYDSLTPLAEIQSQIVGGLSALGMLHGTNLSDDVIIAYELKSSSTPHILTSGSTVALADIAQIEVDLAFGQNQTSEQNISLDLGIPGLGLSLSAGSQLTASADWTLNLGFGLNANGVYAVSGSQTQASPIGFNVALYLDNGFQAVGTMGLLQALLTEPTEATPANHTGLFGSIDASLTGATGGKALNGGQAIELTDAVSVAPQFALYAQSMLQLAFGANFQPINGDPTQGYTDVSDFPSLTAQLGYTWGILGASLSSEPTVALNNITLDVGKALTQFIEPVLAPLYNMTSPIEPLLQFLVSGVPAVSWLADEAASVLGDSAVEDVLPSYQPGSAYNWLDFAADAASYFGEISRSEAQSISAIGTASINIIIQVDNAYDDIIHLGATSLGFSLGNLTFSGKNLALPQVNVTSDSQLAGLGQQVGNFAGFAAGALDDSTVTGAIAGLLNASPVGSALSALASGSTAGVASSFDNALGDSSSSSTSMSQADLTFPFLDHPDNLLGLLFGQQVDFINGSLGFKLAMSGDFPLFAVTFFGIITAEVSLNLRLSVDAGLSFGYDSTGLVEFVHNDPGASLLDGLWVGGNPEDAGTKNADEVIQLDARIGIELSATVLFGLASAGIEGGVGIAANLYLPDISQSTPREYYSDFSGDTTYDVDEGVLGPLDVSAVGYLYVALDYSTFWGFGPSGSDPIYTQPFFTWPNPPINPYDRQPLGFYNPHTQEFQLYVGSTAHKRFNDDDPLLYAQPDTPQELLADDSSTYVIHIGADNYITAYWYDPVHQAWDSQTPSGPVSKIVGMTGDGDNTVIVYNDAPNNVQVDFTGSGGWVYNPNQNSTLPGGATVAGTNGLPATTQTAGVAVGGDDVFESGGGNSTLHGANGADVLVGSANPLPGIVPADVLTGGLGNDTIYANNGDDTINAGSGNTVIYIGAGNQFVRNQPPPTGVAPGDDTIVAGPAGAATVSFGLADEGIIINGANQVQFDYDGAGPGSSQFTFVDGKHNTIDYSQLGSAVSVNLLTGKATGAAIGVETISGVNVLDGPTVASTLEGGSKAQGPDSIYGGSGGDWLVGQGANDYIRGATGHGYAGNTIYGGSGDDTIYAGDGADVITVGDGDDIIHGGQSADRITAGDGDDTIEGLGAAGVGLPGAAGYSVVAGDGDDVVVNLPGSSIVSLGDGADYVFASGAITVGDGADTIVGGASANIIKAGAGNNLIFGGASTNWISDGAGHATIKGGGDDTIYGGALASTILGGQGNDVIVGGPGGNLIVGGAGDNTIAGGAGGDTIYGGGGDNLLSSDGGPAQIFGDHAALAFALSSLGVLSETATTPPSGAQNARATIQGGSGADSLYGGQGSDVIYGGSGTRLIVGGRQTTYIRGGSGAGVTIQGGPAGDVIIGSDGGHDSIVGGAGNNRIELRGSNNTASNGAGFGVIVGGSGADSLVGGSGGQNTLVGGAASDVLTAASAQDSLDPDSGATAGYAVDGTTLSTPTPAVPTPTVSLPSSIVAQGWWSLVAGPAGDPLGGAESDASSPAIVADASGPWVAWTQTNGGQHGLYVAHDVGGTWQAVGGSATGAGLALASGAASNPAIALLNGAPVVAWTSTSAAGTAVNVAEYSASANGGAGGWIGLGNSYTASGLSGLGAYADARIVVAGGAPIVVWRDLSGAAPALRAVKWSGTAWLTFGGATTITGSANVGADYSVATDGTNVAVAWSAANASGATLKLVRTVGASFVSLAPPVVNPVVAKETGYSLSPSLAYFGGSLFVAWTQTDSTSGFSPRLYAARYNGTAWSAAGSDSGLGLAADGSTPSQPTLASGGGKLTLVWTVDGVVLSTTQTESVRALNWNGSTFAAALASDVTGSGVGALATRANTVALALDPNGRPWLVVDTTDGSGLQVRAGGASTTKVFVANAQTSIASLLASGNVTSGSVIVVDAKTTDGALTLGASAAGVAIVGVDGVTLPIAASITINGATGVTLRNLIIPGSVSVINTAGVTLAENQISGTLTLTGATNVAVRDNSLRAVVLGAGSQGVIAENVIAGAAFGLDVANAFSGLISDNTISGTQAAVVYAAAAALAGNRIVNSPVGVSSSVASATGMLGAVAGSTPNLIERDTVGVKLNAASLINQRVSFDATGVTGSGVIGGALYGDYNLISRDTVGVGNFTGLIQFNRIEENVTGVAATSQQRITQNQFVGNTSAAILVQGTHDVQIDGDTIEAFLGDAIQLSGGAYNVQIISNILWSFSGYDIDVANDSQTGFWSDYNTLYSTMSGALVYWTQSFVDILDWQDDVDKFDLHSVGTTVVNPTLVEPHFAVGDDSFLVTRPLVGGARATDPTVGGGDPMGTMIGYSGAGNLLADGNFQSALNSATNWTSTAGGSVVSNALTPFQSTAEYQSGTPSVSVLQQKINLSSYATQIDAGALQVAFGGEAALTTSNVQAQISVEFFNASNQQDGSAIVAPVGTDIGRWMRTAETVYAPAGARSLVYFFTVNNNYGAAGALLDAAYAGVLPRGLAIDQGVRLAADVIPGNAAVGRIALTSPSLYQNWVANLPQFITWNSFGAAAGQPVAIYLMQKTSSGVATLATISASTADSGQFSWSPSQSGVAPGTSGLFVKVVSVANASVYGVSTETFAVPAVGTQFYVATPGAGGSNRNTGVSASSPLPNPVNAFREYQIGNAQTLNIAAGTYPLIVPLTLSGAGASALGAHQGFTISGAAGGATILTPAIPNAAWSAIVDIVGANYVTLDNLTLKGAVNGLVVEGASSGFSAANLTASGAGDDGFIITTNSPNDDLVNLTATNDANYGLTFSGAIDDITGFTASNGSEGLVASGSDTTIGKILGADITNEGGDGMNLQLAGSSLIEGSTLSNNYTGAWLSSAGGMVFGDPNLADGLGDKVSGNTVGVNAYDAEIVGDTIVNNLTDGVDSASSDKIVDNVITGNSTGILSVADDIISGNFISGAGVGVNLSDSNPRTVTSNTFAQNQVAIQANSASGAIIENNLFEGDAFAGVQAESAQYLTIANNTFYELTAGSTLESGFDVTALGAIALDGASTGADLSNNIVYVGSGVGVSLSPTARSGFVSDYNLYYVSSTGAVGGWLGLRQTQLAQWRAATGQDQHALYVNPTFVSTKAGALDLHVQSAQGSDHGGSISVTLGAGGLPVIPAGAYVKDALKSLAIDAGNPLTPLGAEPAAAGDVIEIGAYGGTAEASLPSPNFLHVTSPVAGALITQGTTLTISWDYYNITGSVSIRLSSDGGKTYATTIATAPLGVNGGVNHGAYVWTVPKTLSGSNFVIALNSTTNGSIGQASGAFTISPPQQAFYVNASTTAGGEYSQAPGSDYNNGLSPYAPVADLATLLGYGYTFSPGATIYIDAGTYALANGIVLTSAFSGVTFRGPDNGGVAKLNGGNANTAGFYDFEFAGANMVTISHLTITGANVGVQFDDNSGSLDDTLAYDVVTGDASNLYIGVGDNGATVRNSTISAQTGGSNASIYGAARVTLSDDTFYSNGVSYDDDVSVSYGDNLKVIDNSFSSVSGAAPSQLYVGQSQNIAITSNHFGSASNTILETNDVSGAIDNNIVEASGSSTAMDLNGYNQSGYVLTAKDNTISAKAGVGSYGTGIRVDAGAQAVDDSVSDAQVGIVDRSLAIGDTVFSNAQYGVEIYEGGVAEGDTIYGNGVAGVYRTYSYYTEAPAVIENNTLYNNKIGVLIDANNYQSTQAINNTIVQSSGVALEITSAVNGPVVFRDNILSLTNAIGIVSPDSDHINFSIDYNLYSNGGGGSAAVWNGQSIASLSALQGLVGIDANSISGSAAFVNPATHNYALQSGSPAINRGDPALAYLLEPATSSSGNGDRIDIGAQGGSAAANASPTQLVQLLGQTGGQRYRVGKTSTISFRSAGLTTLDPVLFVDAGAGKVTGAQSWNVWQADVYDDAVGSVQTATTTVKTNGVNVPQAILQHMDVFGGADDQITQYKLPVGAGTYQVTLTFVDTNSYDAVGSDVFNIIANGVEEDANFDPVKAAGSVDAATQVTFDVTTTAASGLGLELQGVTGYALISGIQVSRLNTVASPWTASAQVSYNGGASWTTIASGLTLDAFGAGSFAFTPTQGSSNGQLRIVASNGVTSVSDVSLSPFLSISAATQFYVATAANGGSDANSGVSASAPMASLSALLERYQLMPGDVVNIGAGTYAPPAVIRFAANDSGAPGAPVVVQGAGASTLFSSPASGAQSLPSVFEFAGAHDIVVKNLAVQGGDDSIYVAPNSGSVNVSLADDAVSGFLNVGVAVSAGASGFTLNHSTVSSTVIDNYTTDVAVDDDINVSILNSTITGAAEIGIDLSEIAVATVSGNSLSQNRVGISLRLDSAAPSVAPSVTISSNTVANSSDDGIDVNDYDSRAGVINVASNYVSSAVNDGIFAQGPVTVQSNKVVTSGFGIESRDAYVISNVLGYETKVGIKISIVDLPGEVAKMNTLIGDAIGVQVTSYGGSYPFYVTNNFFYDDAIGVDLQDNTAVDNNTFVQSAGVAVLSETYVPTSVENNIFSLTGGYVYAVPAADQTGFQSNYNLFSLSGAAKIADWAGSGGTSTGIVVAGFNQWMFDSGRDADSLVGAPKFHFANNPYPVWADYVLTTGSLGIDGGDPLSSFALEPGANGGRINLGLEGDTAYAIASAAKTVQILTPAPLNKLTYGSPSTITFQTSGLSPLQAIARINEGGPPVAGAFTATDWLSGVDDDYSAATSGYAVSTVGAAAPEAVYQTAETTNATVGSEFVQRVATVAGTYKVTLNFSTYYDDASTNRLFDIFINGVKVAKSFNIYAAAGNQDNVAVDRSFNVSTSGGIVVSLISDTSAAAMISGVEVDRVTGATGVSSALVSVSPDGGATSEVLSTSVPVDAWGDGTFVWTPNFVTAGNTAQISVTAGGVTGAIGSFLVANAGQDYYVNPSTTSGGQYTSAPGNDLNSGKSPNAPMSDLAALLRAYRLGPGDVVFVDHGVDTLLTDVALGVADSGAAGDPALIQGPTSGVAATLNRANTVGDGFTISGTSYLAINNLSITGAGIGVSLVDYGGAHDISLADDVIVNPADDGVYDGRGDSSLSINNSQIYGSNSYGAIGVYAISNGGDDDSITITNTRVFGLQQGLVLSNVTGLIGDDFIYNNAYWGVYYNGGASSGKPLTISDSQIFDNGGGNANVSGLNLAGDVVLTNSTVYGQTGAGSAGVELGDGAVATNNVIYGNGVGVQIQDPSVTLSGNRIFDNAGAGVFFDGFGGVVTDNSIYSNAVGVLATLYSSYQVTVESNLIYANTSVGVEISGGGYDDNLVLSNTIWQSTGVAIELAGGAINTTLANNIVWTDVGTLITVSADSLNGFAALSNLYYEGAKATKATLVDYGGSVYATLAAWRAGTSGQTVQTVTGTVAMNAGSREGNPNFVNPAGADGVLGGPDTPLGGGRDDNFTPSKNSPAIDAGDAYLAPATDMLGQTHHDDPGVANVGVGPNMFTQTTGIVSKPPPPSSATYINGSSMGVGNYLAYSLPFTFSYFGRSYSTIYLTGTGAIFFDAASAAASGAIPAPGVSDLISANVIAPFWSNAFDTYYGGIYATPGSGGGVSYLTFTFATTPTGSSGASPLGTYGVRLGSNGSIVFAYGSNLNGIAPTIGVSAGFGGIYSLASNSGKTTLSNSAQMDFTPTATAPLTYVDIGAVEFEGASNSATLPTITSVGNLPTANGSTDAAFQTITLTFSAPLNVVSAQSLANYQLAGAGPDGVFGTNDDVQVPLAVSYSAATSTVTLALLNGPLGNGLYKLTVSGHATLIDVSGNPLNGAGGSTNAASPFVDIFTVNRSAIKPPIVANISQSTTSDVSLSLVLSATDPQNLPVTFSLVTGPTHGLVKDFNPVTGAFTYVPDYGYVGNDTIVFAATDSKLARALETVSIKVTAFLTPPVAGFATTTAPAGKTTSIKLGAYDTRTAVGSLTLRIVVQPTHGALTVTGQNTVAYTPATGYTGPDSFQFVWFDKTVATALSSETALVNIVVASSDSSADDDVLVAFDAQPENDSTDTGEAVGAQSEALPASGATPSGADLGFWFGDDLMAASGAFEAAASLAFVAPASLRPDASDEAARAQSASPLHQKAKPSGSASGSGLERREISELLVLGGVALPASRGRDAEIRPARPRREVFDMLSGEFASFDDDDEDFDELFEIACLDAHESISA